MISEEKLEDLYGRLSAFTNVDAAIKATHIENIEKKYKVSPKRKPWVPVMDKMIFEMNPSEKPGIAPEAPNCSKCEAPIVLRMARKGNNAGKQFYGCSNFPKCRYIQNVDSVRGIETK